MLLQMEARAVQPGRLSQRPATPIHAAFVCQDCQVTQPASLGQSNETCFNLKGAQQLFEKWFQVLPECLSEIIP